MNRWPSQHEDLICKWIIKKKEKSENDRKKRSRRRSIGCFDM